MPSVSDKQHNFFEAIAHNRKFTKEAGVSQTVAKEFVEADKKTPNHSRLYKKKDK